jgi:PAB-dependent poly(A)-specific ribonuclease subunit 2
MHDPLANVFDLKSLSPLPPIPFQPGAAFVRMHPKMSTTGIVASQAGQLQVVDIMNPHTVNLKQAHIYENNYLTGLELAPTGEALALSSSLCQIHLWGSPNKLNFAEFAQSTVFPDSTANDPLVSWSDHLPLNSVGMPYYREALLSAWPSQMCEVGALPPKITPESMSGMKRGELGFFGPNHQKTLLNQIEYTRLENEDSGIIAAPKFLSEKAKDETKSSSEVRGFSEAVGSIKQGIIKKETPHIYRNVEIKYSKFGVDDFDFE